MLGELWGSTQVNTEAEPEHISFDDLKTYSGLKDKEILKALEIKHPDLNIDQIKEMYDYQKSFNILTTPAKSILEPAEMRLRKNLPIFILDSTEVLQKSIAYLSGQKYTRDKSLEKAREEFLRLEPWIKLSEKERNSFFGSMVPRGLGTVGVNIATALATGGRHIPVMFADYYGSYKSSIEEERPEWSGLKKSMYAVIQALPETVLDSTGLGPMLKTVDGIGKATLKDVLKSLPLFKNFMKNMAISVGTEVTTEMGQELKSNAIDKLYKLDRGLFDNVLISGGVAFFTAGLVTGVSQSVRTAQIKKYQDEFRSKGFTDAEIKEIINTMGQYMEVELKNDPEAYKQVLKAFEEAGNLIRQRDNKIESVAKSLKDKGLNTKEIMEILDNAGDEGIEQIYDQQMEALKDEQKKAFEDDMFRVEREAIEVGIKPEVAQETTKILRWLYAVDAKKRNKTMDEIALEYNWQFTKGETLETKAKKTFNKVKEDVESAVAQPKTEEDTVEVKKTLGQFINKTVEYEGVKGKVKLNSEGFAVIEDKNGEIISDIKDVSLTPEQAGVKVADIPNFKLSNFGNTLEIEGKDTYTIKDIHLKKNGKLAMNTVNSKGLNRTFTNHNLVLDIDIARNRINTEEQYNRMSEQQKQNVDAIVEPMIKVKIKESKNYIPKTSEMLDEIIKQFYSDDVKGVLEAIENNKEVKENNLLNVEAKIILAMNRLDEGRFTNKQADKLRKIFYQQMEVIENELRKQGEVGVIGEIGEGRGFKEFVARANEIIEQAEQESFLNRNKENIENKLKEVEAKETQQEIQEAKRSLLFEDLQRKDFAEVIMKLDDVDLEIEINERGIAFDNHIDLVDFMGEVFYSASQTLASPELFQSIKQEKELLKRKVLEQQVKEDYDDTISEAKEDTKEAKDLFKNKVESIDIASFKRINGMNLVTIYQTPDATTLLHEFLHGWLHMQMVHNLQDIERLKRWAGVTNLSDTEQYRKLQEKFADYFINEYIPFQKAPVPMLEDTFNKFREWIKEVNNGLLESDIKMNKKTVEMLNEMIMFENRPAENVELYQKQINELNEKIEEVKKKLTPRNIKAMTRANIEKLQQDIIDLIEPYGLSTDEKGIFIPNIKRTLSDKTFKREAIKVLDKAVKKVEQKQKDYYARVIDKLMKIKPTIKQGAIKQAKFDYLTTKLFVALREYNKLNQSEADTLLQQKIKDYENDMTNEHKVEIQFLNYKAKGRTGTSALGVQLLAERLVDLRKEGLKAKSEEAYKERLEDMEFGNRFFQAINNNKIARDKFTKFIIKGYLAQGANQYSFVNAIASKEMAKEFNFEQEESQKKVNVYNAELALREEGTKIYALANNKELAKVLLDKSEEVYEIVDKDKIKDKLSILDIMHIYLGIKNDKTRNDYNFWYKTSDNLVNYSNLNVEVDQQIADLLSNLSEQDIEFADMLQEKVQEYYEKLNEVNIKETGLDLPRVDNYFPTTSQRGVYNFIDEVQRQSEKVSAQKERVASKVKPLPNNVYRITLKHIDNVEHKANISLKYQRLKNIINRPDAYSLNNKENMTIKGIITDFYGDNTFNTLNQLLDSISLKANIEAETAVENLFGKVLTNWTLAKIALNPTVFIKQLTSTFNYIEDMPSGEWFKYFAEGFNPVNMVKTWNFMFENSDYLKERYSGGADEVLRMLLKENKSGAMLSNGWSKFLTSFTRTGDIGAIIFGGYPYWKYLEKTYPNKSKADIEMMFREATIRSQQSGLKASTSLFQQKASNNPFLRLFTVFQNTSYQYLRKSVDASIQYRNGEISKADFIKTVSMYLVIQPTLYAFAGIAGKSLIFGDDWKDTWLQEFLTTLILSPVSMVPLINDIGRAVSDKVSGKQVWKIFRTPVLTDVEDIVRTGLNGGDYMRMIATAGDLSSIPTGQLYRIVDRNIKNRFQ